MKLELAAGERPTPGFVHMDERELEDIEIVGDVAKLTQYVEPESCEQLRATHILEHFSWRDTVDVLSEWGRALEPGGFIYIEVPNLERQAFELVTGTSLPREEVIELIFGSQDYDGNFHKTGFTPSLLEARLYDAGFENVNVDDIGLVIVAKAFKPVV